MRELTKKELGELVNCFHCGKPTYSRKVLPKGFCKLPKGFTNGNARHTVYFKEVLITICETCRYDVFGAY